MAEQFNHKYELQFGQPISFYGITKDTRVTPLRTTTDSSNLQQYASVDNKAIKLVNHNMSFRITKGKDSSTDNEITLYNISDSVRKFLEANNGNKPIILLKAGYETDTELPILFNGEVIAVTDSFNGTTRTTALTVTTGTTSIQEAYTVKSYRKGTTGEDILRDVMQDLKLPEGTIYLPESMKIGIQKPVVYSGPTIEFLRKYGKDNGFNVWIEDGAVNIFAVDTSSRKAVPAFDISSATNMIGSPSVKTADPSQSQMQAGNRQNVTVTTTLNASYSIGALVKLTSKYHSGVYEIESISHTGTYEGNDWQSSLELKPVSDYETRTVFPYRSEVRS